MNNARCRVRLYKIIREHRIYVFTIWHRDNCKCPVPVGSHRPANYRHVPAAAWHAGQFRP